MPTKVVIRSEEAGNRAAIDEVNRLAFGRPHEARLIALLRDEPGFEPGLSLVAVSDDTITGHILFTPVEIVRENGAVTGALALAPMAVRPEWQNQGIGSRLVREGLEACRSRGHQLVVVVGHPEYYPRFGFTPARPHGLEAPFEVPDAAFLVCPLAAAALDDVRGVVHYPPPFGAV
ncbi:MAG: N-acetyltransferase [Pirellulales bacterium]